jgi:hypothetical protein
MRDSSQGCTPDAQLICRETRRNVKRRNYKNGSNVMADFSSMKEYARLGRASSHQRSSVKIHLESQQDVRKGDYSHHPALFWIRDPFIQVS